MVQKWREGCSLKDIFDVSNGIKQKGIEKRETFTFKNGFKSNSQKQSETYIYIRHPTVKKLLT